MNRNKILAHAYLWLILLILYAPIVVIIIFSFTTNKVLGNWSGFSLDLYKSLLTGHASVALNSAIINTIVIAFAAASISTILGTISAIGINSLRPRRRQAVNFINSIPMINPDIITGISLFLLFVFIGLEGGYTTIILSHVAFCTPYVILSVMPRLTNMNPNTYEAALDLGATPAQALRKIIIPELKPGMISGFVLALTLSIDDFAVTLFTKGSGGIETLSTFIYADARKGGLTPELRPLFAIIFILILGLLVFFNWKVAKDAKD